MYKEITDAYYKTTPYTRTGNKNIYTLNENGIETYLSLEGWNHHFLGKLDTNKRIEELKKQVEEEYRIKEEEEKRNQNIQNNEQGSNTNLNNLQQNVQSQDQKECNQCLKNTNCGCQTMNNKNKQKGKNAPINVTYYVSNRPKNRYLDKYKNVKLPNRCAKTGTGLAKISTGQLASTLKSQGSGDPTITNINPGYTSLKEYPAPKFN